MNTIETLYAAFLKSRSVSIDSRKIEKGSLFFALKGDNTDGNKFVVKALESGAAFAVADDPEIPEQQGIIKVENSLVALQELAKMHRKNLKAKVIGITERSLRDRLIMSYRKISGIAIGVKTKNKKKIFSEKMYALPR